MADDLGSMGPLPVIVSPLRRTRETAAPLEARWSVTARIEPGVGEIVSPTADLSERQAWLGDVMNGAWDDLDADVNKWRQQVLDTLAAIPEDAVVVTHFVAMNVAVGAALDDNRVVCFAPSNCGRTVVDIKDGQFTVIDLGGQSTTRIN